MHISRLKPIDYSKYKGDGVPIVTGEQALLSKTVAYEYITSLFEEVESTVETISTCKCGYLRGNFYEGMRCPKPDCNTIVKPLTDDITYKAWLTLPEEHIPFKILHPRIYKLLHRTWLKGLLDQILDPSKDLPKKHKKHLGQGMSYFYRNFDSIMEYLYNNHDKNNSNIPHIRSVIAEYKDILFVDALPALNSFLHTIITSHKGKYPDKSAKHVLKAQLILSKICSDVTCKGVDVSQIDEAIVSFYNAYLEYIKIIGKDKLFGKDRFIRKHIFGSRYHFSFRTVIGPIVEPHRYDEIHAPWIVGILSMKLELINYFMNRHGMVINDILAKLHRAQSTYDADVDKALKTFVKECPFFGLPILFNRNPSMIHGSLELQFVTKFKTDLNDYTTNLSGTNVTRYNADHDGDCMNGLFIKEMDVVPTLMNMHPSTNLICSDKAEISGDICLTHMEELNLHAWINREGG
jgi:hypothetical protein